MIDENSDIEDLICRTGTARPNAFIPLESS
jgi:hypothetical protein